jgi:hypothetical protein
VAAGAVAAAARASANGAAVEFVSGVTGGGGGWATLALIGREIREIRRREAAAGPVDCPNDGTRLERGPDGELYCPFDGWRESFSRRSRFVPSTPAGGWRSDIPPEDPRWGP